MEAVILNAELFHELDACINLGFCMFHSSFGSGAESLVSSTSAEHVCAVGAKVMPPCHGEGEMFTHLLAENYAVCIIILECERVLARAAFEFDLGNALENFTHWNYPPISIYENVSYD